MPVNIPRIIEKAPVLPSFFLLPLKVLPASLHSKLLVRFLNKILFEQIKEGELDFLMHKRLCVNVSDAAISFYISLHNGKLLALDNSGKNDIEIQACVYDFLQIAARQQDPDTLVFQRRLVMQGDTELGLELKNFLDALDLDEKSMVSKIEPVLKKLLPVYHKIFA